MSLQVLAPGLLSSLQALPRQGHRHLGVAAAGALDEFSLRVGNLLLGNRMSDTALEITLQGPRLRCNASLWIAITGADIDAQVDGVAIPGWRPVQVPAGSELRLGACRRGARAYLAVSGGFAAAEVLGSTSTDLRSAFGGLEGRALRTDDVLATAATVPVTAADQQPVIARWWIDPSPDLDFSTPAIVRVLPGSDALLAPETLFAREFRVTAASNRQGLRLDGTPLAVADGRERLSEPVTPGTVQLPPDGRPIVLLADAQTVGGYPRIGHVIRADWPRLAQLRAGDSLRFEAIDAASAHALACGQRHRLARIALAIHQRRSLVTPSP